MVPGDHCDGWTGADVWVYRLRATVGMDSAYERAVDGDDKRSVDRDDQRSKSDCFVDATDEFAVDRDDKSSMDRDGKLT